MFVLRNSRLTLFCSVLYSRMRNKSFANDKLFKLYLANRLNQIDADAVADTDFLCDFARETTHLLALDQIGVRGEWQSFGRLSNETHIKAVAHRQNNEWIQCTRLDSTRLDSTQLNSILRECMRINADYPLRVHST